MFFSRSGLATKGIAPFDLIKHELIKPFSLPELIKDFPVENILNANVTPSALFFFFVQMKDYITTFTILYFDYISIDLGDDQQSDDIHI